MLISTSPCTVPHQARGCPPISFHLAERGTHEREEPWPKASQFLVLPLVVWSGATYSSLSYPRCHCSSWPPHPQVSVTVPCMELCCVNRCLACFLLLIPEQTGAEECSGNRLKLRNTHRLASHAGLSKATQHREGVQGPVTSPFSGSEYPPLCHIQAWSLAQLWAFAPFQITQGSQPLRYHNP